MIKIDGRFPSVVVLDAEVAETNLPVGPDGDGKTEEERKTERLNDVLRKATKIFPVKEGWEYHSINDFDYKYNKKHLDIRRGNEYVSIRERSDEGTLCFEGRVFPDNVQKVKDFYEELHKSKFLSFRFPLQEAKPKMLVDKDEVYKQIRSNNRKSQEVKDFIVDYLRENREGEYVFGVANQATRKLLPNAIYVGDTDIMRPLVEEYITELYKDNKIYMDDNTLHYFDRADFKDNEFNLLLNYRDEEIDRTHLKNDMETCSATHEGSEIWTVKDDKGENVINFFVNDTNRSRQDSVEDREAVIGEAKEFIEENRDMLRDYMAHPTKWKRRELQEMFSSRFERAEKDAMKVVPVVAEKQYNAVNKTSFYGLCNDRAERMFAFTGKLADGSAKLPDADLEAINGRIVRNKGRSVHSSFEEAGVVVDDYLADAVGEGRHFAQALCDMRNEKFLAAWYPDNTDSFYVGVASGVLQYSDKDNNLVRFNPLYPQNAVPLGMPSLEDITYAVPTRKGAIIQKDISKEVGREAYLLYDIQDERLAAAEDYKTFSDLAMAYQRKINSKVLTGYVEKKYWFSKDERDKYLSEYKNMVRKPFGNQYYNCLSEKDRANQEFSYLMRYENRRSAFAQLSKKQQVLAVAIQNWAKENDVRNAKGYLLSFNSNSQNPQASFNLLLNQARERGFDMRKTAEQEMHDQ